jgi:hypothetical protein
MYFGPANWIWIHILLRSMDAATYLARKPRRFRFKPVVYPMQNMQR